MVTVFDIKRFAVHDGPGIRTTVFLKGCPLRCWWCHNPESQEHEPVEVRVERKLNGKPLEGRKVYGRLMREEEVMEVVLRDQAFYEESGGGVSFSGGEPLMQPAALKDLLARSKEHGLHTTVDTCGYAPWKSFQGILEDTDLFLFDLKHLDPELHRTYTGVDNKEILANADRLLKQGARVIFRIPVIPGLNTSPAEIRAMKEFLVARKDSLEQVHLLPYHRIAGSKYERLGMENRMKESPEPTTNMMEELKRVLESDGLELMIGG